MKSASVVKIAFTKTTRAKVFSSMIFKHIPLLIFMITVINGFAQDAHYWSAAYGPGGFITPGATIAKNGDSGVLFCNPALLAYNTKNASTISGNIYNLQSIKIKNGAGSGLNLRSTVASTIPVIASNTIYLKLKNPITIAYALINNPVMQYQVSQRRDGRLNVLDDNYSPGKEIFVGEFINSNTITETSGLLALGKSITTRLAAGISLGLNIRKQNMQYDKKSRVLTNDTSTALEKLVTESEYYLVNNLNIGIAIKTGLSYDFGLHHHFGVLISLPMIHLYGSGNLLSDYIINNLQVNNISVFLFASSQQKNLKTKWKTPFSAAGAYTYDYRKGELYLAAEYFAGIKEYNILLPREEHFIRGNTSPEGYYSSELMRLKEVHRALMNFSLAFTFPMKNKFTGYCSFRTDFNYKGRFKNADGYQANIADWDLYHLQIGSNLKKRKFNLRAGVMLSYGSTQKHKQYINFDNPNERNLLQGEIGLVKATRMAGGFMLAYIHNF